MIIVRSAQRMADLSRRLERRGKRIGVVPTMGALHAGHVSLIRAADAANDVVIVTIFVNPLQFGPREDFRRYPRPLRRDLRLAASAGADIVFTPSVDALYPRGFHTRLHAGPLGRSWEGKIRPGHFDGVATVIAILFHLTRPARAYFGQKDYQQTLIVRRLIADLRLPVRLRVLPTVREPDGLAMSSRNAYLNAIQRRRALVVPRALQAIHARIRAGARQAAPLIRALRRLLCAPGIRVEYAAFVDADTLRPQRRLRGRVAVLVAVRVGRTRLIDNFLVDVS